MTYLDCIARRHRHSSGRGHRCSVRDRDPWSVCDRADLLMTGQSSRINNLRKTTYLDHVSDRLSHCRLLHLH